MAQILDGRPLVCAACRANGRVFTTAILDRMEQHIIIEHPLEDGDGPAVPFGICRECGSFLAVVPGPLNDRQDQPHQCGDRLRFALDWDLHRG